MKFNLYRNACFFVDALIHSQLVEPYDIPCSRVAQWRFNPEVYLMGYKGGKKGPCQLLCVILRYFFKTCFDQHL